MARHDPARAFENFSEAGAFLVDRVCVDYTVLPWRTDAALSLGEPERAATGRARAGPLASGGRPRSNRPGVALQGLMAGGEPGMELLRQAGTCSAAGGETLERAQALIELGAVLRRQGERVRCRVPPSEALEVAIRCGATAQAARARDELAASGARRPGKLTSGPASLTPSERRITEHASSGLTNTQIAQALFVTPKTVEYHLRHVYQKLGISGRTQLTRHPPHAGVGEQRPPSKQPPPLPTPPAGSGPPVH